MAFLVLLAVFETAFGNPWMENVYYPQLIENMRQDYERGYWWPKNDIRYGWYDQRVRQRYIPNFNYQQLAQEAQRNMITADNFNPYQVYQFYSQPLQKYSDNAYQAAQYQPFESPYLYYQQISRPEANIIGTVHSKQTQTNEVFSQFFQAKPVNSFQREGQQMENPTVIYQQTIEKPGVKFLSAIQNKPLQLYQSHSHTPTIKPSKVQPFKSNTIPSANTITNVNTKPVQISQTNSQLFQGRSANGHKGKGQKILSPFVNYVQTEEKPRIKVITTIQSIPAQVPKIDSQQFKNKQFNAYQAKNNQIYDSSASIYQQPREKTWIKVISRSPSKIIQDNPSSSQPIKLGTADIPQYESKPLRSQTTNAGKSLELPQINKIPATQIKPTQVYQSYNQQLQKSPTIVYQEKNPLIKSQTVYIQPIQDKEINIEQPKGNSIQQQADNVQPVVTSSINLLSSQNQPQQIQSVYTQMGKVKPSETNEKNSGHYDMFFQEYPDFLPLNTVPLRRAPTVQPIDYKAIKSHQDQTKIDNTQPVNIQPSSPKQIVIDEKNSGKYVGFSQEYPNYSNVNTDNSRKVPTKINIEQTRANLIQQQAVQIQPFISPPIYLPSNQNQPQQIQPDHTQMMKVKPIDTNEQNSNHYDIWLPEYPDIQSVNTVPFRRVPTAQLTGYKAIQSQQEQTKFDNVQPANTQPSTAKEIVIDEKNSANYVGISQEYPNYSHLNTENPRKTPAKVNIEQARANSIQQQPSHMQPVTTPSTYLPSSQPDHTQMMQVKPLDTDEQSSGHYDIWFQEYPGLQTVNTVPLSKAPVSQPTDYKAIQNQQPQTKSNNIQLLNTQPSALKQTVIDERSSDNYVGFSLDNPNFTNLNTDNLRKSPEKNNIQQTRTTNSIQQQATNMQPVITSSTYLPSSEDQPQQILSDHAQMINIEPTDTNEQNSGHYDILLQDYPDFQPDNTLTLKRAPTSETTDYKAIQNQQQQAKSNNVQTVYTTPSPPKQIVIDEERSYGNYVGISEEYPNYSPQQQQIKLDNVQPVSIPPSPPKTIVIDERSSDSYVRFKQEYPTSPYLNAVNLSKVPNDFNGYYTGQNLDESIHQENQVWQNEIDG